MFTETEPILGGYSDYVLFGAGDPAASGFPFTLTSLGSLTITPLQPGAPYSGAPYYGVMFNMPVTGGDSGTILHQGTGLEITAPNGAILVQQDFRYDLQTNVIYGNVTTGAGANHLVYDGNMPLYTIAANGIATPTEQLLTYIYGLFGAPPPPPAQAGASGAVLPSVLKTWFSLLAAEPVTGKGFQHPFSVAEDPIIGGMTTLTLTGAASLQSLGITETPLGSASMYAEHKGPVVNFAITGGTVGEDGTVILNEGSGLELSKGTNSVDFRDFLFDTKNGQVDADVYANGALVVDQYGVPAIDAVFDIGHDMKLTLTGPAANELNKVFGTTAFADGTLIGTATTLPIELPAPLTALLNSHFS
jgi:hypothetical protein